MTDSLPPRRVLNWGFVFLCSVKCAFFFFNVCGRLSRTSQLPRTRHRFQTFYLKKCLMKRIFSVFRRDYKVVVVPRKGLS